MNTTKYMKQIEISSTGMVTVTVRSEDRNQSVTHYFRGLFNSTAAIERRVKKAHKWADEFIEMCARNTFHETIDK